MAHNVAQVDECWEQPDQTKNVRPYMQANGNLRALAGEWKKRPTPTPVTLDILGVKVEWTPDKVFPPAVLDVISQLFAMNGLEDGWDSYGAKAMDTSLVETILGLVFAGHQRGVCPHVVPLSSGGIGLRWRTLGKEVDIDILAGGLVEMTVEDIETGEISEIPVQSPLAAQSVLEATL
jgi:hypothetical protein